MIINGKRAINAAKAANRAYKTIDKSKIISKFEKLAASDLLTGISAEILSQGLREDKKY